LWLVNHKESGNHKDIVADSISVETTVSNTGGTIDAEGDISTDTKMLAAGDVIASYGSGSEVGLGELRTVNGTAVLAGELIRQMVMIGGASGGFLLMQRAATSPFTSGNELAIWSLGFSTTVPFARFGNISGTMTMLDGGTGSSLDIGSVNGDSPAIVGQTMVCLNSFRATNEVTAAQITSNQNDYAPTGHADATALRVSSDASRNITGLAGGAAGRWLLLMNVGAQDVVLIPGSGLSTAANRFICPGGANFTLNASDNVWLYYSGTDSRWRVIGV